jgi:stage II sporulation protein P
MIRIKDDAGNIKSVTCKLDKPTVSMDQPLVYIYNSHQNESYSDVPSGQKSGILQISLYMKDLLVKSGIPTIVEEGDIYAEIKKTAAARKAIGASRYDVSKKFIEAAQKKHPSLVFFLDIHRNSSSPMTVVNGKECAVFFFLIGASQKDYEKNLAVATAIDTPIRAKYPTLARKIYVRGLHNEGIFWYNQFMGQYFQLIEVGGDRSTLQQAKNTVDLITPYFEEYIKSTFMKKE